MDLYSIEKTKDYTFFKFVNWYYKLTPRTIRLIKLLLFIFLIIILFVINHFSIKSKIPNYIYIIIYINFILVLLLLEKLIKSLARGTGNEKMIELCNAIKESNDSYLYFSFKILFKITFIIGIIYGISLFIIQNSNQNELIDIFSINIINFINILAFFFGVFIQGNLYYYILWMNSISITRASSHSIKDFNDFCYFTYFIPFTNFTVIFSCHIIILGIFFEIIYLLFYLINYDFYSYPYNKIYYLYFPYFFGISLTNIILNLIGIFYYQTGKNVKILNKINNYKNPLYISNISKEIIIETIKVIFNVFIYFIFIFVIMIIINEINDKESEISEYSKIFGFCFPVVLITINLVLEYIRLCCIKTKIGIPKGGTEYQEAEDIIKIFKKGSIYFIIIKIIIFILLVHITFINNYQISNTNKNVFILYCSISYFLGMINKILIIYIGSIYFDKNSLQIKNSVSSFFEGGFDFYAFSNLSKSIEIEIFCYSIYFLSVFIIYLIGNNYIIYNKIINNQEVSFLLICFFLFGYLYDFPFMNVIPGSKILINLSNKILKLTNNENDVIEIICIKSNYSIIKTNKIYDLSQNFYNFSIFYLFLNCLNYIYNNIFKKVNTYYKIDISNIIIIFFILFGIFFIKLIFMLILNSSIHSIQTALNKLTSIYQNNKNNLVERTKIDYQQCTGIITQISIQEIKKYICIIIGGNIILILFLKFLEKFIIKNNNFTYQGIYSFNLSIILFSFFKISFINNFGNNLSFSHFLTKELQRGNKIIIYSKFCNRFLKSLNILINYTLPNYIIVILMLNLILIVFI